jgi:hypothetical protein
MESTGRGGAAGTAGGVGLARPGLLVLVLLLLGAPGCFTYVPADPQLVPADETVRVVLHPDAARRLAGGTAASGPGFLEGTIVSITPDSLRLSVPVAGREHRGTAFENVRQTYRLTRSEVLEFQTREFSRGRTVAMGAVAGAGLAFILTQVFDLGGSGGDPGGGGPPNGPAPVVIPIP